MRPYRGDVRFEEVHKAFIRISLYPTFVATLISNYITVSIFGPRTGPWVFGNLSCPSRVLPSPSYGWPYHGALWGAILSHDLRIQEVL